MFQKKKTSCLAEKPFFNNILPSQKHHPFSIEIFQDESNENDEINNNGPDSNKGIDNDKEYEEFDVNENEEINEQNEEIDEENEDLNRGIYFVFCHI